MRPPANCVYNVTLATEQYSRHQSSYDTKRNRERTYFQPKPITEPIKPTFLLTSLVNFVALKMDITKRCEIDYPISTPEKNKKPGGRYSSIKLRKVIAKMLFYSDELSDDRWSLIRSLSLCVRTIPSGEKFRKMVDKSKVYTVNELETTLAIAVFLKMKHFAKFPSLNQTTFDRVKSWLTHDYNYLTTIDISYPTLSIEQYALEIEVYCPWFSPKTIDHPELKKELISYGNLQELLKKTFYGYAPTPQYLGQLGFDKPQTRLYSLQEYYKIRLEIIESRRRRNKPDNYIIFDEY